MRSPSSSLIHPGRFSLHWRNGLILLFSALISIGIYLLASAANLRIGFPLDDAWIHQTYARNFAQLGEWSFIPGQISGASTSPLWTLLLAFGSLLGLAPFTWTFVLGGLLLAGLALQLEAGLTLLVGGDQRKFPWAGLLVIFEWHFVWSALSGMETLLHASAALTITLLLFSRSPRWLLLGILVGLSTWIRPDGVTLIVPVVLQALLAKGSLRTRLSASFRVLAGFFLLFIPYLVFNFLLSGNLFPTTFYAKQAEYIGWQTTPIFKRLLQLSLQFLSGAAIILLPGVVIMINKAVARRAWGQILMFLWMLGYLGIYLFRLPSYQHGRYLIPAMPVFFLFGLCGLLLFIKRVAKSKLLRLLDFSWSAILSLVCLGFWILGIRSYIKDVEFIETEMVDTALWVSDNLPAEALVAAHDIGALGYFDHHELVDLAGLITPEIIPILRDESRLAEYMHDRDVSYLVGFPDWFPTLVEDLEPVFTTGASYSLSTGGTNMTVYRWEYP